jgi:F-type H+-transporting ATPase subunit a
MNILQLSRDIPTVGPNIVLNVLGIPIANTTLMSILISVLVAGTAYYVLRNLSLVPGKIINFIEWLYEGMLGMVGQITGKHEVAIKIFPLIGTIFIFFGISNLLGLIPGLTEWTMAGRPILRVPTSDINTTIPVAAAMILLTQLASIKQFGIWGHISKYVQIRQVYLGFKQGAGFGFNAVIGFLIGLLDIVSEFAKIISLSLRLFGNMYAGIVLAVVIMGGFAYALPSLWMAMGILTGIVQAIVFGALVATYYSIAVEV